jgi:predicted nucleic acid-binding protein
MKRDPPEVAARIDQSAALAQRILQEVPAPRRLAATEALALLDANFVRGATTVALTAAGYRTLLRAAPDEGVSGGRTHDAVIAACARKAGARTLLTFNPAHFTTFAGPDLEVIAPPPTPKRYRPFCLLPFAFCLLTF